MSTTARSRARLSRGHGHRVTGAALLILLLAAAAYAQIWTGNDMWQGWRGEPPRFATRALKDGQFHFCRLMYPSAYREAGGQGWRTDYPGADTNFSIRLGELTKTAVSIDGEGDPEYFVVRSSGDDNLFHCPFVHIEDAGTAEFTDADVVQLREYLLKGGFMWSDDFWGSRAWAVWEQEIGRVLPPERFPIVDIPVTHSMFQTIYNVKRIPQVPAISRWRNNGGETSERGLRQRSGEHARHLRREGPADGVDDAQHRHFRYVGARRRGRRVFLSLFAGRLCGGHQRDGVRDDALEHIEPELRGLPRARNLDRQHHS